MCVAPLDATCVKCRFLSCFFWPTQANVVCVVYDVTNEDTINKVFTHSLLYNLHAVMKVTYAKRST